MDERRMSAYTPSQLILARSQAFSSGDFGFIFDSYHAESNFRRQFPDRNEYCRYGEEHLAPGYNIVDCRILDEDFDSDESRVVFLMRVDVQGDRQVFAELAWLKKEGRTWRYHRGQKMTAGELPDEPESLTIGDFSRLDPMTVF